MKATWFNVRNLTSPPTAILFVSFLVLKINNTEQSVFVMQTMGVYCEVGLGSLNIIWLLALRRFSCSCILNSVLLCTFFTCMLLLPEGQTGETREPSKKWRSFFSLHKSVCHYSLGIQRFYPEPVQCEVCGGQSGTGAGFSPSASDFPCQCHSTNVPYSPSSTCCFYKDKRTERWEPSKSDAISEIGEQWIEKYLQFSHGLEP
jgi:hypothetical protein